MCLIKRMAIKEQSDDGFGVEAHCDHLACLAAFELLLGPRAGSRHGQTSV